MIEVTLFSLQLCFCFNAFIFFVHIIIIAVKRLLEAIMATNCRLLAITMLFDKGCFILNVRSVIMLYVSLHDFLSHPILQGPTEVSLHIKPKNLAICERKDNDTKI